MDGRPAPVHPAELARKADQVRSILRWMTGAVGLGALVGFGDPRNDVLVTAVFFGAVLGALAALGWTLRRGQVVLTGIGLTVWLWLLVAFVTLFFGGLKGGNATLFGVTVMLAGSLLSWRAAVWTAVASSAWCAVVGMLELGGSLPAQLGPYTPMNAWSAFTISLIIMVALVRNSLASLQRMHRQAAEAAAERDVALRRSIQSQKMEVVGTLASGVAHDFNNLLAVIVASAEGLRHRAAARGDREGLQILEDLQDATDRAILLTRQMLSYGRGQSVELEPVDLAQVVASFVPLARRVCGALIEVHAEVAPGPVMTMASPAGLEQVLLNLVTNARDAMPAGGRLDMVLASDGKTATLRVKDSGKGMDEPTRAHVFDPFFSTKRTGMGLGLATVHDLATRFGGTVTCASAPGAGTTFEVQLPVLAMRRPVVTPPAVPAASKGQLTILLVDDDPLVRRAMTRTLENAGYTVIGAEDGQAALDALASGVDIHGVVSDIVMPRMDGKQLAERLRELRPDLPLVLISGNDVPSAELLGRGRRFLAKPVGAEALVRAISEAMLEMEVRTDVRLQ